MTATPLHAAFPAFNRVLSELRHADSALQDVIKGGHTREEYDEATRTVRKAEADLLTHLNAHMPKEA